MNLYEHQERPRNTAQRIRFLVNVSVNVSLKQNGHRVDARKVLY